WAGYFSADSPEDERFFTGGANARASNGQGFLRDLCRKPGESVGLCRLSMLDLDRAQRCAPASSQSSHGHSVPLGPRPLESRQAKMLHGIRQRAFSCLQGAYTQMRQGPCKQKAPRRALLRSLIFLRKSGAGEGIRTLDPNLGKVVLYP